MKSAATLLTLFLGMTLAGCAVSLGPGYTIERQQVLLTYSPQEPGRVHVRGDYRLKNTGNRELDGIRAAVPLGAQNLRVSVKGAPLALGPAEKQEDAAIVPLPFASPLAQKAKLELTLEFDLATRGDTFYFRDTDWFFKLRPPDAFRAKGAPRADKIDFTARVPEDFRVLSGGLARGSKKRSPRQSRGGAEREFRFRYREDDFDLFVLAGPYVEQQIRADGVTIIFWTLQPVPAAQAQGVASDVAQAIRAYEETFGPRINPRSPVWVTEFPTSARVTDSIGQPARISSFPHGVRITSDWLHNGAAEPGFAASFDVALAELWFTHLATPDPYIGVLDFALPTYAQEVVRESHGQPAERRAYLAERIRTFEGLLAGSKETPIISLLRPIPAAQLEPARIKALLFLFAIDEKVGSQKIRRAMQRVAQAMRGSTYSWNELRSALEAESGQDLGEMFRTWLTEPGIPEDFRARYASQKETGK